MKKVAATRGQSVSFATFFLVVGMALEQSCVGTDIELNSYSRPPKRSSLSLCGEARSQVQDTGAVSACNRKMLAGENFLPERP